MESESIIEGTRGSASFESEAAYMARSGFNVQPRPRLLKRLENDKVRLIFPTVVTQVDEGIAVGLVCLYDLATQSNLYAHPVFAGSGANAALKSLFTPQTQAKPQPGVDGNKAIVKFIAWKQAAWGKFLNDELELGVDKASAIWLEHYWKALDRMYGGGNLRD